MLGDRCHRIHILPPLESQSTPSKPPFDSDLQPKKVTTTDDYIVKIPNPRFQAQMPLLRLNSQSSCFINSTDHSPTPVVRLRRSVCLPEHLSQNPGPTMYDGYDNDLNSWGCKTGETSWSAESPNQNNDLNSWGRKTDEGSWSAEAPSQNNDLRARRSHCPPETPVRNHVPAMCDDLNSWGYKTAESSRGADKPSQHSDSRLLRSDPPPENPHVPTRRDEYDLNSWGYKTDESSWGVETPVHNSDLNSWGCKTADSSWSGETPVQDSDLNSWGGCKTEGVWGSTSLSSDDSSSSTETASSQSSTPNRPQAGIRRLPPRTCHYWLRGTCYSGSGCRWFHPVPPSSAIPRPETVLSQPSFVTHSPPPANPQTCRDWLAGHCNFGSSCRWIHPDPSSTAVPKPETVSSSSFAPNHSRTEVNHHLPPPNPQTCRNWLRGNCTLGSRCKWVHADLNHGTSVRGLAGTANYEPKIIIESTIIRRAQVEFSVDVTFVFHCNPVSNAYKTSAATKSRDLSQLAEGYLHPRV
ncbi:hypothetical protein DFH08DRAFT_289264 [Mycena albidolilacea]|uniref:C3H1-type domain-containing protein n=1 Tax=Mycena albidolilacea TaxID=1033008 RepID=A0AAD7EMP0_9AGAR|nr:hypothetical protein DFH08DRAFT_289264 [Mycena albidolilacea]